LKSHVQDSGIILTKDESGWIVAEVPSFPGCFSQGRSEEEATANIQQAIAAWLWAEEQRPIRSPRMRMAIRAVGRNRLIIALSRAMIVVEAGKTGGTLNAGLSTLKAGKPLYIAVYEDMPDRAPGNEKLLQLGGGKVFKGKQSGRAKIEALFTGEDPAPTTPQAISPVEESLQVVAPFADALSPDPV
jgi:predicted RNase H-like HicB family nuclease